MSAADASALLRTLATAPPAAIPGLVARWREAGCPGYRLQTASDVQQGIWLCLCPDGEDTCTDDLERCDDCGATRPEERDDD